MPITQRSTCLRDAFACSDIECVSLYVGGLSTPCWAAELMVVSSRQSRVELLRNKSEHNGGSLRSKLRCVNRLVIRDKTLESVVGALSFQICSPQPGIRRIRFFGAVWADCVTSKHAVAVEAAAVQMERYLFANNKVGISVGQSRPCFRLQARYD
jgi:hypothetical protein